MRPLILFLIFLLTAALNLKGQPELKIFTGIGYPSGPFVGAALSGEKLQFEFDYGWPAQLDQKDLGNYWAMNVGVRFGQESEITNLKSWIFRMGPTFQTLEDEWEIRKRTSLMLTFGRELNLSKHFACEFHVGPALTFYKDEILKKRKPDPNIFSALFEPLDIHLPIDTKVSFFIRL